MDGHSVIRLARRCPGTLWRTIGSAEQCTRSHAAAGLIPGDGMHVAVPGAAGQEPDPVIVNRHPSLLQAQMNDQAYCEAPVLTVPTDDDGKCAVNSVAFSRTAKSSTRLRVVSVVSGSGSNTDNSSGCWTWIG